MSETINDGGPAFPLKAPLTIDCLGMSLRDYFAAKSLPLSYKYWMEDYYHPSSVNGMEEEDREGLSGMQDKIAEYAYMLADAMLAARDNK